MVKNKSLLSPCAEKKIEVSNFEKNCFKLDSKPSKRDFEIFIISNNLKSFYHPPYYSQLIVSVFKRCLKGNIFLSKYIYWSPNCTSWLDFIGFERHQVSKQMFIWKKMKVTDNGISSNTCRVHQLNKSSLPIFEYLINGFWLIWIHLGRCFHFLR